MDFAVRIPQRLSRAGHAPENQGLWTELEDVRCQLDAVSSQFELLTDDALIDACCYQLKALNTRYARLLQEARDSGLRREPWDKGE